MPQSKVRDCMGGKECLSTSADSRWAGFLVEKHRQRLAPPSEPFALVKTHLLIITSGEPNARWRASGSRHTRRWQPGTLVLLDSGYELDEVEFDAPREHLMIELDTSALQFKLDDWQAPKFIPHVITEDRHVAAFAHAMQDEIERGCPTGRLFAESLSLAMLTYVAKHYSTRETVVRRSAQGLSSIKLRRVIDFIHDNLSSDLSLAELATLVDLNPQHLCRSFRQATGTTPYRYILNARIERAKIILATRTLSIAQVALAVGFSSQSHFSAAFRQHTGMSPRRFERN